MTLGIIAPASVVENAELIDRGCSVLQSLGFRTRVAAHARSVAGTFAGCDADRAADLCEMVGSPDVDGIVCVRGGHGSLRTVLASAASLRSMPRPRPKVF